MQKYEVFGANCLMKNANERQPWQREYDSENLTVVAGRFHEIPRIIVKVIKLYGPEMLLLSEEIRSACTLQEEPVYAETFDMSRLHHEWIQSQSIVMHFADAQRRQISLLMYKVFETFRAKSKVVLFTIRECKLEIAKLTKVLEKVHES